MSRRNKLEYLYLKPIGDRFGIINKFFLLWWDLFLRFLFLAVELPCSKLLLLEHWMLLSFMFSHSNLELLVWRLHLLPFSLLQLLFCIFIVSWGWDLILKFTLNRITQMQATGTTHSPTSLIVFSSLYGSMFITNFIFCIWISFSTVILTFTNSYSRLASLQLIEYVECV